MSLKYLNNSLIHWTGRDKPEEDACMCLESICRDQVLFLSYCPKYTKAEFRPESSMVCFTDIPLEFSKDHCTKFGQFGIAFRREPMMKYGANPVFYTTEMHFNRVVHVSSLLSRMADLEKDREWREYFEKYPFSEDDTLAMQEILGFLQEYTHIKKTGEQDIQYFQREWRLPWNVLPFADSKSEHIPGTRWVRGGPGKPNWTFKFAVTDVDFLVAPRNYCNRVKNLANEMNCGLIVYEDAVRT